MRAAEVVEAYVIIGLGVLVFSFVGVPLLGRWIASRNEDYANEP